MKNILLICTLLIIIIVTSDLFQACNYIESDSLADNRISSLEYENNKLRERIKTMSAGREEEERAIFQYICFVDSVEGKLNDIYSKYIFYNTGNREIDYDKKADLLNRLNLLKADMEADRLKIEELEHKLAKASSGNNNGYLSVIIDTYKKKNAEQERRIIELRNNIERMKAIIRERDEVIDMHKTRLAYQNRIINDKQRIIDKQRDELDRRYVLLISKDRYLAVEMDANQLYVPQRINRISILTSGSEYYSLEKVNNNLSLLRINEDYWGENRIMAVYIRGSF